MCLISCLEFYLDLQPDLELLSLEVTHPRIPGANAAIYRLSLVQVFALELRMSDLLSQPTNQSILSAILLLEPDTY